LRASNVALVSDLSILLSEGVPKRSLGVALIVGTVLNLINQGDALLGSVPIHLPKLLLTFAVPISSRPTAPCRTGSGVNATVARLISWSQSRS